MNRLELNSSPPLIQAAAAALVATIAYFCGGGARKIGSGGATGTVQGPTPLQLGDVVTSLLKSISKVQEAVYWNYSQ